MRLKGVFGTEFQISSKTLAVIFAATGALLAALSAKAIPVPMGIPDIAADYAQSWANFLLKLWAPIGPTLLVLFSDSTPGPLAPPDPAVVQVATKEAVSMGQITKSLIILGFAAGALSMAFPGHASAAPAHHAKALPSPFTPYTPPATPTANPVVQIQTVTLTDLKNALTLANAATPTPGVTQPAPYNASVTGGDVRHGNCWAALVDFVGNIQAQNILPNQSGLATLQQTIFDDQQQLGKPLLPDFVVTNCALTFNDAGKNVTDVINWIGVKAIAIPKF